MAVWTVFCRLDSGKAYYQSGDIPANHQRGAVVSTFGTQALALADAATRQKAVSATPPVPTFVVVQTV